MNNAINYRNELLTTAETELRQTVKDLTERLMSANLAVFGLRKEMAEQCTQAQVFQLLQNRLQECGTHCGGVRRY